MTLAFKNMNNNSTDNFHEMFDSAWLRNQVKTHLFFGEYSGKYKCLLFVVIYLVVCLLASHKVEEILDFSPSMWRHSGILIVFVIGIVFGKYKTNAMLWVTIKATIGAMSFIFILIGLINFFRPPEPAISFVILGLTWLPSIEFIPKLTTNQKYITLIRVGISAPLFFSLL